MWKCDTYKESKMQILWEESVCMFFLGGWRVAGDIFLFLLVLWTKKVLFG